MKTQPTFVIAGPPRAGTTSLHYYLAQHPQVAMTKIKEPNHFLFRQTGDGPEPLVDDARIVHKSVSDPVRYDSLFQADGETKAFGDVSPLYLYTRDAPALLAERSPAIRAIAVLRDPVERAWSHFNYIEQSAPRTRLRRFEQVVELEMARGSGYEPYRSGQHFLRLGLYAEQLARFSAALGPQGVKVVWHQDLVRDPSSVLADICRFIDVDPRFEFDVSVQYNRSGSMRPWSAFLRSVAGRVQPRLKKALPPFVAQRLGQRRAQLETRLSRPSTPLRSLAPHLSETLDRWFEASDAQLSERYGTPPWRNETLDPPRAG